MRQRVRVPLVVKVAAATAVVGVAMGFAATGVAAHTAADAASSYQIALPGMERTVTNELAAAIRDGNSAVIAATNQSTENMVKGQVLLADGKNALYLARLDLKNGFNGTETIVATHAFDEATKGKFTNVINLFNRWPTSAILESAYALVLFAASSLGLRLSVRSEKTVHLRFGKAKAPTYSPVSEYLWQRYLAKDANWQRQRKEMKGEALRS